MHCSEDTEHDGEHCCEHVLRLDRLVTLKVVDEEGLDEVEDSEGAILHELGEAELESFAGGLLDLNQGYLRCDRLVLRQEDVIVGNTGNSLVVHDRISDHNFSFFLSIPTFIRVTLHAVLLHLHALANLASKRHKRSDDE